MVDIVSVTVYPREGTTYPDASGTPVMSVGATVDTSKYIRDAIRAGFLLTWDPLGVYQPEDRTTAPGGGGDTLKVNSFAQLGALVGTGSGQVCELLGCTEIGDGGGGTFYWATGASDTDDGGTIAGASPAGRWKRVTGDMVNVRWFGARGNNDQTLQSTSYPADVVTITQQTADAIAINKAIRFLRENGGSTLYIPAGTYRVRGYLEPLDFSVRVVGDGIGRTILKATDTCPIANGMGVLLVGPTQGNNQLSTELTDITIEDLTVDGNATVRTAPVDERRAYNIAIYGSGKRKLVNVESINSVIDCLVTYIEQPDTVSVGAHVKEGSCSFEAVNCHFDNAYRNTVSVISGYHQKFVNCNMNRGGNVHGGFSPRSCVDIEPDIASRTVKDLRFVNCSFADSFYATVTATCCEDVKFIGCRVKSIANAGHGGGTGDTYPRRLVQSVDGQIEFHGCHFQGDTTYRDGAIYGLEPFNPASAHFADAGIKLIGCTLDSCGIYNDSRSLQIEQTTVRNSKFPVLPTGGSATCKYLMIRGLSLINVIDGNNWGGGADSAFSIPATGDSTDIDIDGLTVRIVPELLGGVNISKTGIVMGMWVAGHDRLKMCNVHVAGYWKKYATHYGLASSSFIHRDWNSPNAPPADTAGQTAAPGSGGFYRNCTEYGDNP